MCARSPYGSQLAPGTCHLTRAKMTRRALSALTLDGCDVADLGLDFTLPGQPEVEYKLFRECWKRMPLMDIHHFPLWEKGVHDCLQQHFPVLMRIFSHYTKGISGIDSAADALEMELEEFHDFVKDAKLETKLLNFTTMTNVFAKANAENTAEAFAMKQMGKRNSAVQAEVEAGLTPR